MERRLAAVLAADVVGYSRLMGGDEAGTLRRLKAVEAQIIEPLVEAHRGRIVKRMGDGYLIEFASVVASMECAVAWQSGMAERESSAADERRIRFRIGINLGDVMAEEGDLFGDGVNVAARLEGLADPGGICLSAMVRQSLGSKLDLTFEDMGERSLKNIAEPLRVYRVAVGAVESEGAEAEPPPDAPALPDKPSIAVLPFTNLSRDPEQDYFADGISEDIITGLSRARWFFVIARNSSFKFKGQSVDVKQASRDLGVRYLLEGSVRKAGARVRVGAQLVEGASGKNLWAQRYDRALEDIFEVQDEITEAIVGALEPELSKVERKRSRGKRPENLDAWDLYQRGMSHLYHYTREDLEQAADQFRQAVALDPNLGPAYSGLAETYYYQGVYGLAGTLAENGEKALEPARRAVALDGEDAGAHCTLGRVLYLRREHEAAMHELQAALDLNPSLALAHYGLGAAFAFSGRAREATPHLEAAIRLSPHDPNMGSFLVRLADANYFTGNFEDAVDWAKKALQQPNFQWSRYAVLLAALGRLGRTDEARPYLEAVLRQRPDFSLAFVRDGHLISDSSDLEHYLEGLGKVLPET